MPNEPVGYVVSDLRPHGRIVTGVFRGPDAKALAHKWAVNTSTIHKIMTEQRLARMRVMDRFPVR
jgi:hypothetical protein